VPVPVPVPAPTAAPALAEVDNATRQRFDEALRLLKAGQAATAAQQLRALAQAQPALAGVHANLGLALRAQQQLPEAVAALQQATQLNPALAPAWRELGLTLRQAGRFAEARAAYERALALAPGDAATRLNLGVLLDLYLAEPAAALPHYERFQALQGPARDPVVDKWVLDLKNRKPAVVATGVAGTSPSPKDKP
jgi:Flp pilus assembly protein TadD